MIEVLRIKNLALIDDLELEFGPGLNVLTGETGAGKSFIISAVNFLTGEKMHTDLVTLGFKRASAWRCPSILKLRRPRPQRRRPENGISC